LTKTEKTFKKKLAQVDVCLAKKMPNTQKRRPNLSDKNVSVNVESIFIKANINLTHLKK